MLLNSSDFVYLATTVVLLCISQRNRKKEKKDSEAEVKELRRRGETTKLWIADTLSFTVAVLLQVKL